MELRAHSGVLQTPGLSASGLQARAPVLWEGQLCGHWEQGYGPMFQSGHLGASVRRPRDPGGEGP